MNIVCSNQLNQVIYVVLTSVIIFSCSQSVNNEKVSLFVAASLVETVDSLANFYSNQSNAEFEINVASSGTLAKQIEQGAPAMVYFSANINWLEYLSKKEIIHDTSYKNIAGNQLVLIKSKTDSASISSLLSLDEIAQLGNNIAIGTPGHVPAGKYAKEAMEKLNFYNKLEPAIIFTKDVKAALILAEIGETNYAIVYKTDALCSSKVEIVEPIPDSLHSPIILSAGLIHDENKEAIEFYNFLSSSKAKEILKYWGFKAE